MSGELHITQGFSDELRAQAASLYDAAFGAKLAVAIPDAVARQRLLAEAFDPAHSFVALAKDRMVGIAGFQTSSGALTSGITVPRLYACLGLLGCIRALLVLTLYERAPGRGQLLMDGISVAAGARGGGVGTQLLSRLKDFAAREGYRTIRLDVIDSNHGARRLYERLGFVATETTRFEGLQWLLGFDAATTLECRLGPVSA